MKKHFTITVDIDTEEEGWTHVDHPIRNGSNNTYDVFVRSDVKDCSVFNAVAHEVGHALAAQLRNGSNQKKEVCWKNKMSISPEQIFSAEKEAWDVAKILTSMLIDKKKCLKMYKKAFCREIK